MRPVTLTVNLSNQSATRVAAAQQIASAGALTLAAGASNIDNGIARNLLFTTTEDDSTVHYTVVGLDADGNSITETSTLPNNTTKVSTKAYASVSSITLDAGITANMSVGTSNATHSAISRTIPLDFYNRVGAEVACEHTGTIVYTIEETFDPILGSGTGNAVWFSGSLSNDTQNTSGAGTVGANLLSISSADARSALDAGCTGCRVNVTSYSNGATLTVQIVSPANSNQG